MRRVRCIGLCLAALGLLGGCTTRIVPPVNLQEPATVFVLDHGRHTSLVVPAAEGGLVRYAYGDWRYYAERKTGPGHAIAAILWSTPGALGRRALPGPATAPEVRAQVPLVITDLYEIEVERQRIDVLRAELDAYFDTADIQLETPEVLLSFVRHPRAYNLRHNSNTALAGWLETLGCRVSGPAILARWHVDRPTPGDIASLRASATLDRRRTSQAGSPD